MKQRPFLRGLDWKAFGKCLWKGFNQDRVTAQSAQLSFYFLLAIFPLLIFLTSLLGLVLHSTSALHDAIMKYLYQIAPEAVSTVLNATLEEVASGSSGSKLSLGLLGTLWAASNGMAAIINALNIVYDVPEARRWWKRRIVALVLTIVFAVLTLSALTLLVYGPILIEWLASRFSFGALFTTLWTGFEWLLALALVVMALNMIYIYAPNVKHHQWHWLMPGTAVALVVWLLASYGFKIYLTYFNRYSVTYGSIGAVIILLLWFYLTGIAILVGAEVNAEIEKQSGRKPEQKEGAPAHEEQHKSADELG